MSRLLGILVLMMLTISGCEKDDEVVPAPAPSDNPSPADEPEVSEEVDPPLDVSSELYQYRMFRNLPYRILMPRNYDSAKIYPLHLFLHGLGERGTDNEKQLSAGGSYFQIDSIRQNYPAFIIFPQCPPTDFWDTERMTNELRRLIDSLVSRHDINADRISIGGFSMGAYGVFEMVSRNPGFFEAAVAISGDGDPGKASLMAKTKWRIFAGKRDDIVASAKTELMATALEKAGASVSFKLYPEADHGGTWLRAFSEPDFFYWLFSRRHPELEPVSRK
jgi:predicted peptidase